MIKNEKPKVSVIIPVYNVSEYVEKSLLSALYQSYENIEILIVDDASPDDSMLKVYGVLRDFKEKKEVRILTHEENKGLSEARNTGIKESTGQFIFFMDSDDTISEKCIELHLELLLRLDADCTIAGININKRSIHHNALPKEDILVGNQISSAFFERKINVSAWNKLYRKSFINEHRLFFHPRLIHEDVLWSFKVFTNCERVGILHYNTYNYDTREGSITTSSVSKKQITDLIFIIKALILNQKGKKESKGLFKYVTFLKFNTALLVLNYKGLRGERKKLYQSIQNCTVYSKVYKHCFFSILLSLPYYGFYTIMNIPYLIYKKLC